MASFKELSLSRPFPHSNHNRHHHSHSISLGAVNPNHRVTRRKSVTTTAAAAATNTAAAAAAAAVAAASIKDSSGEPTGIPMPAASARRGSSRKPFLESSSVGASSGFASSSSYLSRSMNNPSTNTHEPSLAVAANAHKPEQQPSAPNGPTTTTTTTNGSSSPAPAPKNRNRRASEGSHLVKGEGKRALAEIRCDRCGKGYKHGSCLSKHMWEHDPAWAITSKLLISKHQQVQLLEAASVLVNMNHDGPEAESELSSASPDASSERHEGLSSADTTPPPMEQMNSVDEEEDDMEEENDDEDDMEMSDAGDKLFTVPNNNSNNPSGLYSRSYQTGPSSSFTGSAPLHSPSFSNYQRHSSIDTRPSTADTKLHDDDEADLAAAIGLCNFGTPRTRPVALSPSIPPVPPLPSRFLDPNGGSNAGQQSQSLDQSRVPAADAAFPGSVPNMFLSLSYNPSLSYKVSDEREVRMGSADRTSRQNRNADVDFGSRPAPADDDDDGVFGQMEE